MYTVRYGGRTGKKYQLTTAPDLVAIRTRSRNPVRSAEPVMAQLSLKGRRLLDGLESVTRFPDAGVEVFRHVKRKQTPDVGKVRASLKREPDVRFAGRVLVDRKSKVPVLYTENFFIKFDGKTSERKCRRILREHQLEVKRALDYARNAFFVAAPEGTGRKTFAIGEKLLEEKDVELCHPELVRQVRGRNVFPQQWHLAKTSVNGRAINAHVNVEPAWALSEGQGVTIAIIDDGVDVDHAEFSSVGKVVAPRDVTRRTNNARPGANDNHGTCCAGVACADGQHGASGVAPMAHLMPIRLVSGLGSQSEADAFFWAAQNGADVISCSWGPMDGNWWDDNDPVHDQLVPLPDSTRLAIDWAVTNGRSAKGCVIMWAAGNGNESVENDGYASYDKVMAVAACNELSKRSAYSDFGPSIHCAFPSDDGVPTTTPGIWTVDRSGTLGYNRGSSSQGDPAGDYTNSFGGTSSASPGAAGVAALVVGRNPDLRWDEVKDVLRQACDRIDEAGGKYDQNGHSQYYGYGRINAKTAVDLAIRDDTGEEPPAAPSGPLAGRPVEDVFGIGSSTATSLRGAGVDTVGQLAEADGLDLAGQIGEDPTKTFAFMARARTIANHTLDAGLFGGVSQWTLSDVLKEPITSLAAQMGQSETAVASVKAELASLAAAIDNRLLRQLTMSDVGV